MTKKTPSDTAADRDFDNLIRKRASDHFDAMSRDVARGKLLGGKTPTEIQIRYLIYELAKTQLIFRMEKVKNDTK